MSTRETAVVGARPVPHVDDRTVDQVFVVLSGWLMAGVFLDAWAHISRLPDSFWTPWHGILYSGLLACGAFLVVDRFVLRPATLRAGYDLSLIGFGVGLLGGIGDALWHTVFGIEFDIEAAVSPSHLTIAAAIFLVVSGPLRAAWARRSFGLPAALSTAYAIGITAIIVDYADPFARVYGGGTIAPGHDLAEMDKTAALFAFMLYAALISGALLVTLRHMAIGAAWLGLIVGTVGSALVLVNGPLHPEAVPILLVVALASGALVALAAWWLGPSAARARELRAFAFLVPAVTYAVYAGAVTLAFGTWWSPTFWGGVIATGGLAGLLLSSLAIEQR